MVRPLIFFQDGLASAGEHLPPSVHRHRTLITPQSEPRPSGAATPKRHDPLANVRGSDSGPTNKLLVVVVDFHPQGIHLPEIDIWLDATEPRPDVWISHGHGDHAQGVHHQVFGTAATLWIY